MIADDPRRWRQPRTRAAAGAGAARAGAGRRLPRGAVARRPTARSRRCRPPMRAPGSSARRRCCAMPRPPPGGSMLRRFRRSTCWNCSPLFIRRGSVCRRRAVSPRRSASRRPATRARLASASSTAARALLEKLARGNRSRGPCHRGGDGSRRLAVGPGGARCLAGGRARRAAASCRSACLGSVSTNGRSPLRRRPPATSRSAPDEARSRLAELLGAAAEPRPQQSRLRRRRQRPPLRRAQRPTSLRRSSPKPAPGSARRSAISRRPASGRKRTAAQCGSRPSPAICRRRSRASSTGSIPIPRSEAPPCRRPQGPREFPLPAELRGRGQGRASGAARKSRRQSRIDRALDLRRAKPAIWSPAISRAGSPS